MTTHAAAVGPLSALDVIYGRRSVRAYTSQALEPSTVRALLDAAVQAPTAMHEQPWLFVVVQDRRLLSRLSDRVKVTWINETAPRPELHVGGGSALHQEFIERLQDPAFDVFYGARTLVVICARRTDEFVTADCWLAAENLMLAAAALGLGTCCIGAAVRALNEPEIKGLLRIPADVHAVAPIIVGVPAEVASPAARREPEVLSWT